ncbi:MAG TPA: helix-turn-helix domain-containing protein [Candidatus Competibacteraceae bacterium]|nr:helix-turn-helix domain-containing protein [Candidatus Competibacteraceae bacterium]
MSKGEQTRAAILAAALDMARQLGLEGLTIGTLAERLGLSKSGVFAHFGSKEELQLAVLREAQERFVAAVLRPALAEPRGLARLRALFERWLAWSANLPEPGGCLMMAAAYEFDDRPGPVRDALAEGQRAWRASLTRTIRLAIDSGELRPDTDAEQFAFELFGVALAAHHDTRLLGEARAREHALRALERLIADARAT